MTVHRFTVHSLLNNMHILCYVALDQIIFQYILWKILLLRVKVTLKITRKVNRFEKIPLLRFLTIN